MCQSPLDSPLGATNQSSECTNSECTNSECTKAVEARQHAIDMFHTNPTSDSINEYKNCQASAIKVIKENKRES